MAEGVLRMLEGFNQLTAPAREALLRGFLDSLTPRSAEAEVRPRDAHTADVLAQMRAMPQPTRDQQIQGAIVSAAEAVPEGATLGFQPLGRGSGGKTLGQTLPPGTVGTPGGGKGDPIRGDTRIDIDPAGPHLPKTVAHELLHFLNYATMQKLLREEGARDATVREQPWYKQLLAPFQPFAPNTRMAGFALGSVDAQHEFINFLLGKERPDGTSTPALTQRTYPDYRGVYSYAIKHLFQDPALRQEILDAQEQLPMFPTPGDEGR